MKKVFADIDFSEFWDDNEYAKEEYVSEPPSEELITSVEKELGYKLPLSYIELMKLHNGGVPKNTCFSTHEQTSRTMAHVNISGILGIGREKPYSLCGSLGSQFMIDEWGYPSIGVCICNCPSAGHDIIMLDYRQCGRNGEPKVVHVDQEWDYKITFLALNFEVFIRGLVNSLVGSKNEK
ncbi:MAG: SMI1/KNR4 family protein [Prochloraceae cyanobacterium]|nr:SMI1/KNR4 family protein [Prochloraceae cyanobacterium]